MKKKSKDDIIDHALSINADTITENIVLHDYGHPGVVPAVDKFCEIRGYKLNVWRPGQFGLASIEKS